MCFYDTICYIHKSYSYLLVFPRAPCAGCGTVRIGPASFPGVPNDGVDCFIKGKLSASLLCLGCMWCFVSLFLIVRTSAIDCLERRVSKMSYYVSSGTFNRYTLIIPHSKLNNKLCLAVR